MNLLKSMLFLAFFSISLFSFSQKATNQDSQFALGFFSGYNRGLGFNLNFTALKPIESLPLHFRFGIGYTSLNPGNSADARRIFINNATNGVPEEKGKSFDYRLDFMWKHDILNLEESYIVFGPRYSSFTANFNYIGGNEDFDVTSKQFGLGIGAETQFKISEKFNLAAAIGLDYFFNNTLKGHDSSYSPDDDNVNPRDDNQNNNTQFTYSDANKAIKQPSLMPRVLLGVVYKL
ncbi:hypothetical protein HNV10_10025 [Winogradskyella litoriviva]|uniref:Outer membrane protein beta-barrel domain-containing protein n=1 Tax=Winogradskyella litoriviva TaxID=1220182 RepID=A0ABX2E503_9FLAO|nr:hypothetical protein [Winogradskyella litoriviva]NRD23578.1 hypothetical protein [Winogradskyella litoriviva]